MRVASKLSSVFGLVLTLNFIFLVFACSQQPTTSGLFHTDSQPVKFSYKWQWHEVSEVEFTNLVAPQFTSGPCNNPMCPIHHGQGASGFLGDDHAISVWLNEMIGILYDRQKELHPEQLKHVPRPQVKVLRSSEPNAAAVGTDVCLSLPVQLDPEAEMLATGEASRMRIHQDGSLTREWSMRGGHCIPKGATYDDAVDFKDWINKNTAWNKCEYSVGGDENNYWLIPNFECIKGNIDFRLHGIPKMGSEIVYTTQSNIILVKSAYVNELTFNDMTSTLAHELAHMLRAHAANVDRSSPEFGYYFPLPRINPNGKPQPDESEEVLRIASAVKYVRLQNHLRKVEGQKFASQMFSPLFGLAFQISHNQLRKDDEGKELQYNKKCDEVEVLMSTQEARYEITRFPARKLSDRGQEIYLQFETLVEACLKNVVVSENEKKIKKGRAVHPRTLLSATIGGVFPVDRYMFYTENGELAYNLEGKALNVIREMEKLAKEAHEKSVQTLKEAADIRLGFYSVETEADDLSVEIVARAGLDPNIVVEDNLALVKKRGESKKETGVERIPFDVGYERCNDLYKNNWLDDGEYFYVPVADFTSDYPSDCFRAFNAAREIEAHGYSSDMGFFNFEPPTTDHLWEDLQELAAAMN